VTSLPDLCAVVPCFNEADALPLLHPRLVGALDKLGMSWRILYVDDGSTDGTFVALEALVDGDSRVTAMRLARNFGKELALTAALDHADAAAVVVLDADLQDPPELIEELVARYREGHDMVYGVRRSRAGESWLKRTTAHAFYRLMSRLSATPLPRDTGDFRLLSRRAVLALRQLRERHRFMKGLFTWVGFRQIGVEYDRDPRAAGHSKFNYWRLWNFALEGVTSFSTMPLRAATYIGFVTALLAFGYGAWTIAKTLLWGEPVRGYPSMMAVMLMLGGVQLIALGLIGEYLGRLYAESKQRPLYLIERIVGAGAADGGPDG